MRVKVFIYFFLIATPAFCQKDTMVDADENCDCWKHAEMINMPTNDYNTGFDGYFIDLDSALKVKLRKTGCHCDSTGAPFLEAIICIDTDGRVTKYKMLKLTCLGILYYYDPYFQWSHDSIGSYDDSTHSKLCNAYTDSLWNMALKDIKQYPIWKPAYNSEGKPVRTWHFIAFDFEDMEPYIRNEIPDGE